MAKNSEHFKNIFFSHLYFLFYELYVYFHSSLFNWSVSLMLKFLAFLSISC